jgi:site-specific DNA recombinase
MGRLTLNILLSFAQFEREIIGERIRDKIAAQRRKGKWAGGIPVLGYDVDRSCPSPKLVINPDEAARVRTIFELYLKLGSLLPVVEELPRRGWQNKEWKTKKGDVRGRRPFDKASLHALLTNPIYVGKVKHKSDLYEGEHVAIVDPDQFRRVQSHLQQNGRTGGSAVRNKHGALLKRLLVCKGCSRAMVHTFTGKGTKRYRYYTCSQVIQSGRKSCPSCSLPAAEIEAAVVDQIRCIADDAGLRAEVFRQARTHVESELQALQAERPDFERAMKRDHAEIHRLTAGGISTDAATTLVAELHDRVVIAEQRIAALGDQIAHLEPKRLTRSDVNAAFANFDNVWNALSPREQTQVLALLIDRVEFDAADSSIAVTFHPSAIKTLADGQLGEAA